MKKGSKQTQVSIEEIIEKIGERNGSFEGFTFAYNPRDQRWYSRIDKIIKATLDDLKENNKGGIQDSGNSPREALENLLEKIKTMTQTPQ